MTGSPSLLPGVTARQTTRDPREGWYRRSSQSPDNPTAARLSGVPGPPQMTDVHQASLLHGFTAKKSRLQINLTVTASEVEVRLLHVRKSRGRATRGSAGGVGRPSVCTGHRHQVKVSRQPEAKKLQLTTVKLAVIFYVLWAGRYFHIEISQ